LSYAGDLEESIKGIGPETARKLVRWGICTVESLAIATVQDVVAAGVGEATAVKIIEQARDMVALTFIRADELCCTVQLPRERGGLEPGALYFDTEQTFLARLARVFNMAAVVTNQMISNPSPYGVLLNPAGGDIVAHASHTRLSFTASKGQVRKARLIDSSYLPEGEILFQISEVAKGTPIEEADKIAEEVKEKVSRETGCQHCVIHVDPANNSTKQNRKASSF